MWRFFFLCAFVILGCGKTNELDQNIPLTKDALFQKLGKETGISFSNNLIEKEDFDVFRYRNYYNGGGVGIGDFNNDGRADVFMTSNMESNKLFINQGDWKFRDITDSAGVAGTKAWSTGVSVADVNADGFLDIYVCNAGDVKGNNRENELFINNGDLTFTDRAKEFGLADLGFTTHAAFFDYDKDGDLDCYVLNNSYRPVSTLGYKNLRHVRDEFGGHKLYNNHEGRFSDVSDKAGIFGSVIGFGLGVTVGDVNQDNWPDLYISNDFYERDYLYINAHDGTFKESLESYMGHISMFSMGADLADLNNDGYPEIFSTDMLPNDDYRLKTLIAFETYDVYQLRLKNGYYHQFMRNMLHKNNKDGTFSELGQLAGVDATDWSWGALLADFNNDGYKEIFVCNGIFKDVIDQDFIEYLGSSEQMRAAIEGKKVDFRNFVDNMPSVKLSNYMFTRTAEWQYKNVAKEWGLSEPNFSNGAAYADLDNDGDLDLIINHVNQQVSVYKNLVTEKKKGNFLSLKFTGTGKNTFGLGTSVKLYHESEIIYMDNMPIRGFQSSMDYKMTIGIGERDVIDSLVIRWPDQKEQVIRKVEANRFIDVNYRDAIRPNRANLQMVKPLLTAHSDTVLRHVENNYNDFDRDRLLYHMLSTEGPGVAKGDLNNDGLDDIFLGGSVGSHGTVFVQLPNGSFSAAFSIPVDQGADQVDAAFFDSDGDGDLDLYIITGGSEHTTQSAALEDYLFENVSQGGKINFEKTVNKLPKLFASGSCVRPMDFDNDGDIDLFVGTRHTPSYYGLPCDQYLLRNDGGTFKDVTLEMAPELKSLGMVTDAQWADHDSDGSEDLIVIGEFMPITIFANRNSRFTRVTIQGLSNTEGFWQSLSQSDIDNDGDTDFILGNLGLNSIFHPTVDHPVKLYLNDFDKNGSLEPIFSSYKNGKEYPMALRQDVIKQMSSLKKKFVYYKDYAGKPIEEIFDPALLKSSNVLQVKETRSGLLVNEGNGILTFQPLPVDTQVSPIFSSEAMDIDGDKIPELFLGGNLFAVKPEAGRYDALHGLALKRSNDGTYNPIPPGKSGISIQGEIRDIEIVKTGKGNRLLFVRNNDTSVFYRPTQ